APILFFIIVAVLIGGIGNLYGIEVIARYSFMGVLSIIIFHLILLMGSIPFFDIRELMPVMQSGFLNTLWASRHNDTDWAMATTMVAVLLPSVKASRLWGKSGMSGILMGGLFVVMWPILEGGVLSPEVTAQYTVSCMQMARSAQIGDFIHRYEMFMVAFFAVVSFVQIMLCFLCASEAVSHLFSKPQSKGMIIPTALMLGASGYAIVFDKPLAMKMLEIYWPPIALSIAIGVPIILLLLGTVMRKRLSEFR
ncbi:GerAB/ArcD/ProY family transporter, partial [Brevibacillus sp. SYSU BS000544]|uniref:GerAB/ArcD/ProY family transporter n=1 Tax=Brevibacillus sp. SYSU BS000544 TaxID=3416443 RepID=UPI003CE4C2AB